MRHYFATKKEARLDRFLNEQEPALTRSFVQKLIKEGHVFVNGKKALRPGQGLKEGDEIIVSMPSMKEIGLLAEDIPLDIVHEDKDLVVVNKPAGMVVHPTDHGAHVSGTLVNALMHHCKDLSGIGGEKRPGIVHRLDKGTSGLIVCAKNDAAHRHVSQQIEHRKVTKTYLALLQGHLEPAEGSIEAPLIKTHASGGQRDVAVSGSPKAKYALTHYKVQRYCGAHSLAEIRIVTGRTHQIRVHFDSIGHPVLGDEMYGDAKANEALQALGLKRPFLHAWKLKFRLPEGNREMELEAPLPKDLKEVLKRLEG